MATGGEPNARVDDEADGLVEKVLAGRDIEAAAALLECIVRWDPKDLTFPPQRGISDEVHALAKGFLERRKGVLDDAFGPGEAVDWDRVRQAQECFMQNRLSGLLILGCASLPACYAIPEIAVILTGSGRLMAQVTRRLQETIDFLQVMMTPRSLEDGGIGVAWIRKVRLMHALMRKLAVEDAKKHQARPGEFLSDVLLKLEWGPRFDSTPIDQEELAYVLLTFSWLLVRGFPSLQVRLTQAQKENHIYAWSVIGHGLGIARPLRPTAPAEAKKVFENIRRRREEGTERGRLLTAALLVFVVLVEREQIKSLLPPPRARWLQWLIDCKRLRSFAEGCIQSLARSLIRSLVGRETAETLWVSRAPFIHWLVGKVLRAGMTLFRNRTPPEVIPPLPAPVPEAAVAAEPKAKGLPPAMGARLASLAKGRVERARAKAQAQGRR